MSLLKKTFALTAAGIGSVLTPLRALAQGEALDRALEIGGAVGLRGAAQEDTIGNVLGGYINAALGLLGAVLLIIFVYAGFLWMTAGGSEERVTKAKGLLKNAIIGIVIVFAAYAITSFIVTRVTG